MEKLIEFCQTNLAQGTWLVKEQLENREGLIILDYECLGHCELCSQKPFALLEGEIVAYETKEQLFENLNNFIQQKS